MNDVYPTVAITASAITLQESGSKMAEENLKRYCTSGNMDLSLMSKNYLLYMNNKQPFIETIEAIHEMKGQNFNVKAACLDFLGSLGLVPNNTDYKE